MKLPSRPTATLNGCVAWEGNSLLNGVPIVVILSGFVNESKNRKTGPVVQSYILLRDTPPVEALKTGEDEAICGNCPLRKSVCYVNVWESVSRIYNAYKSDKYSPEFLPIQQQIAGFWKKTLRIGSYGDPAAVPYEIWENIIKFFPGGNVGYTHQWKTCDQRFNQCLMASVETVDQQKLAESMGWRTYRISKNLDDIQEQEEETVCLNQINPSIRCEQCKLCDGMKSPLKKSIVAAVHGSKGKVSNFNRLFD